MAMFHGARGLTIEGGEFTNHVINNIDAAPEVPGSEHGLQLIRKNSALGALLDSNERLNPPKCHPATRTRIIRETMAWISSKDKDASMQWIHGSAGAGKTALAQSIAELAAKEDNLAATFFFARLLPDRNDGNKVMATLAHQIAITFPQAREHINRCVIFQPDIFYRSNLAKMQQLLLEPAKSIRKSLSYLVTKATSTARHPRLIVIDGLDECSDKAVQRDLLDAIGTAVQGLQLPFRFLVLSRPDPQIFDAFNRHQSLKTLPSMFRVDLDAQPDEIEIYLRKKFQEIKDTHRLGSHIPPSWPPDGSIQKLVQKASKQFIYAATAIKYIESPCHRPMDRLNIILSRTPAPRDNPFAQLDVLYAQIFASTNNPPRVKQIFGALVIQRTRGDFLGEYDTPEMLDKLLFYQPGDVRLILSDLLSLVRIDDQPNVPIKLLHESLGDFLLDESRSQYFFVDLAVAHETLARGYLALLKKSFVFAIAYLIPFLVHLKDAAYTTELWQELQGFNFIQGFNYMYTEVVKVPGAVTDEYGIGLKNLGNTERAYTGLEEWRLIRKLWETGFLQLFCHFYFRQKLADDVPRFQSQMNMLREYYIIDRTIMESLTTFLLQPRFRKWCCEPHVVGHRSRSTWCHDNPDLAYTLHLTLRMCVLHKSRYLRRKPSDPPEFINSRWTYECFRISATMLSKSSYYQEGFWPANDNFFAASLDCATILLSWARSTYYPPIVELLVDYPRHHPLLFKFPSEIEGLTKEVVSYYEFFSGMIDDATFRLLKKKWIQ